MKSRITIPMLTVLLALGAACNKPNSQSTDNSAQPADNSASQSNAPNAANEPAQSAQPRVPASVTVPAGKVLTVSLAGDLGSKISQPGQTFGGTLAKPVEVDGEVVIPAGAKVEGEVVDAKPLGRFKGGALLQLKLDSIHVHGEQMPVQTAVFTQTLKGKGKRTGVMAGGGAGLGALIGGLAGGGKGAAIGAVAGAGAGTAGAAYTGNKEIVLPAESAVPFTLKASLKVRR
ncbi:MAG TPA: hypothetical protein VF133_04445 [Terriglobales bacterium]